MRWVIADDSSLPRDILRANLARLGEEVVAACANGMEAVDACRDYTPDVVILDLSMPIMTGNEAAKIVADEHLARVILIATSNTQDGVLSELPPMCRILAKPYMPPQLDREVRSIRAELQDGITD